LQENGRGLVEALPQNLRGKPSKTAMTHDPAESRTPHLPITRQEGHWYINLTG